MRKFFFFIVMLLIATTSTIAQQFIYPDIVGKPGFDLVDSKLTSVRVNFTVPGFSLEDQEVQGINMKYINLPGTFLFNEEGMPNLPGKGKYIAIPQGSTPKLRVITTFTEIIHNVEIVPAPRIPLDNDNRPVDYVKNMQVYSKNEFYPASPVTISEVTQIRGVDAIILGITPFQYNPVTKDLLVYKDIQVKITFEGGNGHFGNDAFRSAWWDPILQDNLLNYTSLPVVNYNARLQTYGKAPLTDECEYIILTPTGPDFLAWADTIRKFRTEQGVLTKVFTVDQVGGNTVTAIEAFINNAYNTWTIKPVACLILGDYGTDGAKNIISHLYTHPASYPSFASDNKYADVNNDEMPDVVFSRITANDATQLEIMVTKFLNYERNPPVNPRFYDKPITALGWQTERWFQLCSEVVGGYFKNVHGKNPRRINKIYSGTPGTVWSTATNTNTMVNYFGPNGLNYIPSSPATLGGWDGGTATHVNQAIDSGAFMLQHRDHGEYFGWGEPSYKIANINQLTNTDLTFVFSINCQTGAYQRSSECFGEHFHRYFKNGHNSGALGLVCPSEVSYSFVNDTFVWGMYDNMWPDFMPAEGTNPASRGVLPAFGCAAGKYFLKQSNWPYNGGDKLVTYRLFHMFGDAFQVLYTEIPQPLTVTHDLEINYGDTTFAIQTNDSAFIALTCDDQILATGYGSASGPVNLTIPLIPVGSQVKVTVTKHNFYRYTDFVPVTTMALQANFSASATNLCIETAVDFTDLSSGDPISWAWIFQGGTPGTSTDQNPTGITYNQPGNHDVTLTVSKATGDPVTMIKTAYIKVTNMPVADFQDAAGCPGLPVAFTDQTNANGGTITNRTWNFGDPNSGSNNTSYDQNPTHTYNDPGTYIVSLEVKTNGVCTDIKMKEVVINSTPSAAVIPQGETSICKDVTGMIYTTDGATGATTYNWLLEPEGCGTITGNGPTGSLTLTPGFTGAFTIRVQGENECGHGVFSEELPVAVIEAPAIPEKPSGADSLDVNKTAQSNFTVAEVPGALTYAWMLAPEIAGTIIGSGGTGTVVWNNTYRGLTSVTVKAINACGESVASEEKTLNLYSTLGLSENNGIGISISPNPNDGKFSLDITSTIVSKISLTVYNTLGIVVYTDNDIRFNGKLHRNLDLSNLSKGVYRLKVEGKGVSNTINVVIGK
ncbi:MAG: C25 family cysteine peptidase [Bacteroidales bacterium]|nr:C25 family cysteine peptidase [Bacteroidales bacterium]